MFSFTEYTKIPRVVKLWLLSGLVMIFFQIVIGGVTRLTGSGLSITRWEIVTGSIPPLSDSAWQEAFDLYKATPQYAKINEGMSMHEFKFIYFWEYFHRVWARLMFLVFIIPFGWFLWRGMFSKRMVPQLIVVMLLAGLEGFFGWIMVASGLIHRPWVNAYNLTLHLCMALIIFSYLLWITFSVYFPRVEVFHNRVLKQFSVALLIVAFFQIALGAMMSGTKAGLIAPTWPDMHGSFWPAVLLDASHWTTSSFVHYDSNPFMPTLIQFLHRNTAYFLTIMCLYFYFKIHSFDLPDLFKKSGNLLLGALFVQILLGILTLINCISTIPIVLGVLHQAGAVFLLGSIVFVVFQTHAGKISHD